MAFWACHECPDVGPMSARCRNVGLAAICAGGIHRKPRCGCCGPLAWVALRPGRDLIRDFPDACPNSGKYYQKLGYSANSISIDRLHDKAGPGRFPPSG